ncbi:MAG: ammonium transporter [candidate division KSB1 bacterium]|nr:ammonium transporter [candidate division KSB1 bacterium]MDZ7274690.1 ammonium transporter [candidate division KSB1 bacterium]MDZ7285515.1 ammonium transporter [candidate division KSB1 bacterium]MDZ7298547.1 ammonium transporter [candidate division KSB1 bacterium]MDZ7306601.1 ammonium transporter [candidate division KSB1 bacterium]
MRKKRSLLPFGILLAVSLLGAVLPTAAPAESGGPIVAGDVAWMLTATGLVLLMTPGLSFFYGGMVRLKNVISTMLQSFIALGVISLLWIVVGFSLAFGKSIAGLVGNPLTYFMFRGVGGTTDPALAPTIPLVLFALFQLKFAIITPALITGSFAERVRFSSYLLFICLFSLFIYAPLAHWTWHPEGFLRQWGVLDFAGGTVVHMSAGLAALAGALVLGRRRDYSREPHVPANIPFVILGTGMLWFGWFGFNAGSALAASETATLAFLTTNTASASAMLAWILFDTVRGRKPSALGACIGAVVGLVAITPAAGYVTVGASIFIGTLASIVSNLAVGLKSKATLDDTLDVFPCHGVGGMVGMVATGVFAQGVGLLAGNLHVFLHHLLAIAIVSGYCFGGSFLLYKLTDWLIPLRVSAEQEEIGLDLSQHGESVQAEHSSNGRQLVVAQAA